MAIKNDAGAAHAWRFFRSGGFDQVSDRYRGRPAASRRTRPEALDRTQLPHHGARIRPRTLALLDGDGDGQIRVPEILAAVRWACERVKDPAALFARAACRSRRSTTAMPRGRSSRRRRQRSLAYLGKSDAGTLTVADFDDMTRLFSPGNFNGDGVVPAAWPRTSSSRRSSATMVETQGAVPDRSGEPGITVDTLSAFSRKSRACSSGGIRPRRRRN
jgi:hypothetical protein